MGGGVGCGKGWGERSTAETRSRGVGDGRLQSPRTRLTKDGEDHARTGTSVSPSPLPLPHRKTPGAPLVSSSVTRNLPSSSAPYFVRNLPKDPWSQDTETTERTPFRSNYGEGLKTCPNGEGSYVHPTFSSRSEPLPQDGGGRGQGHEGRSGTFLCPSSGTRSGQDYFVFAGQYLYDPHDTERCPTVQMVSRESLPFLRGFRLGVIPLGPSVSSRPTEVLGGPVSSQSPIGTGAGDKWCPPNVTLSHSSEQWP